MDKLSRAKLGENYLRAERNPLHGVTSNLVQFYHVYTANVQCQRSKVTA